MERTDILVIGADDLLRRELQAGLAALGQGQAGLHWAGEWSAGLEQTRLRGPRLILWEIGGRSDLSALSAQAEELAAAAPESLLVGVFHPDSWPDDVTEGRVLIEAIRGGVRDFLRRPVSAEELRSLLERARESRRRAARRGTVIAFLSNKGGVGKSTTAVNLACLLAAKHPEQVLLIDASLQHGVCASHLDLHPENTLWEAAAERDRLDESLLRRFAEPHECGLHLLAAPHDPIRAAEIDEEAFTRVLAIARRAYDLVIVDTFPLLDRLNLSVLDLSDRVYVVLESVVPTLQGGAKLLQLLKNLEYPAERTRVILNRYSRAGSNPTPAAAAERLGRPIDFVLPESSRVTEGANLGRPYPLGHGGWIGYGRRLKLLAAEVNSLLAGANGARHSAEG